MSVSEKIFFVTPEKAYERSIILEKKIAIVGPSSKMSNENINKMIGAYSNVLIYNREMKKAHPLREIEGFIFPNAHLEFLQRVNQIASQVNANYQALKKMTGLRVYDIK